MVDKYEDDQYVLNCRISWKLKESMNATVKCEACNGHGYFGGPMSMENTDCHVCWGDGKVRNPELKERPDVPDDLIKHITKEFQSFGKT